MTPEKNHRQWTFTAYVIKSMDVKRSIEFYTRHLGFKLDHQQPPAFASVSLGDLTILLSGPGRVGVAADADGRSQEPGGWNRVVAGGGGPSEPILEAAQESGPAFSQ